jgi:hypothetical protein
VRSRPAIVLAIGVALVAGPALARHRVSGGRSGSTCSATAEALLDACRAQVVDDSGVAKAICLNIPGAAQRGGCLDELAQTRADDKDLCREQRDGRLDACKLLGEAPYDPDLDPARFDDPKNPSKPNRYFPLTVGNRWDFRSALEVDTVEVVNETKLIEGVRCAVVRDTVNKTDGTIEDTDDWYANAKDGKVWYFGEETKDFEIFAGDDPQRPELVSIEGSFKAGRDGDKPGIIFLASPKVGDVYLEEFSLGNAEDVTVILSTTYRFGSDPDLDHGVPQQLADHLCSGDCVVTKNFSLLEPGLFARKYYAPGIGVFLEVESEGEVLQLVGCNVDPTKCTGLPQP